MRFVPNRRAVAALVASVASLLMALPAGAGAASSKYPPSAAERGFSAGAGEWTSSVGASGVCLAPVLCPRVENSFQEGAGAGDGFIRSAFTGVVGVTAVGGTTTGTWESPRFTYEGAAGEEATAVSLSLDRRADVDQLLAVSGNAAEFMVRLIDLDEGGEASTLIPARTLAGANSWTAVERGSIDPGSLTPGHAYRIQIVSSYTTGTSVLVTGSADYDNVVLQASDGANGKGKGGKGKGGNGGGALGERRLEELLRQATPGTAVLGAGGKRLFVRVKCPRKVGRACRTTAQGLLRKRRPATRKRTVRLRSGKSRLVALPVKPKARKQVAKRKRLLVRQKVRAGKVTATIYKSRRLVRR